MGIKWSNLSFGNKVTPLKGPGTPGWRQSLMAQTSCQAPTCQCGHAGAWGTVRFQQWNTFKPEQEAFLPAPACLTRKGKERRHREGRAGLREEQGPGLHPAQQGLRVPGTLSSSQQHRAQALDTTGLPSPSQGVMSMPACLGLWCSIPLVPTQHFVLFLILPWSKSLHAHRQPGEK